MAERTKKNVPQIRFKGFSEEWEEKALGSVYKKIRNAFVGTATPFYVSNGFFYLESNNVKDGAINRRKEIFINEYFYLRQKDNWLHTDDIVMVQSGHVGHSAVIPKELNNTAAHALIIIANPIKETDSHFVNYQLQSQRCIRQIENITIGNTIKHILSSSIKNYSVCFSSIPEQSKIGTYFQELDQMIELHQRKHEKLMTLKKAMLKKMFPQNGATTPEIRFKGFSEPWEEKKLSDISIKVTEKNVTKEHSETFTNSAEYGIVSQRDYFDKDISNSENIGGYYVVKDDNFVYNPRISSFAPVGPVSRNKLGRTGVMSPLYTVFRTHGVDNTFLEFFFKTDCWHPFMFLNGDTGARSDRFSIKDTVFIQLPIPHPTITEQRKIGTYFRQLDELIAQHETQLTKLKQIKTACLEKMFV